MVTPEPEYVVRSGAIGGGIAASDAHLAAEITYRQLDHWARQGWVRPSISSGEGRWAKRLYANDDVVRLGLLRHLAVSRVSASAVGPLVGALEIPAGDVRMVWGPVGAKDAGPVLQVVGVDDVLGYVDRPGAFVVFDPARVRTRLEVLNGSHSDSSARGEGLKARRTA